MSLSIFRNILYLGLPLYISASPSVWNGQLSGWSQYMEVGTNRDAAQYGFRYIPSIEQEWKFHQGLIMDIDIAGYGYLSLVPSDSLQYRLKPYRLSLRLYTDRFEARIGLQKISFGPGKLLRSLMWFDRLDPRDPLQLTEGVYGMRFRYDFPGNTNFWVWALMGNDDPKGWEIHGTDGTKPEIGGRILFPLGMGEVGFTTHTRWLGSPVNSSSDETEIQEGSVPEYRIAVDSYLDVGPGLWIETALIKADLQGVNRDWQSFLTIGMDYTLGIGNGLTIMGETMVIDQGAGPFENRNRAKLSGLMVMVPFTLLDQLSGFYFLNWDQKIPYYYFGWQRTYDNWIIHVSAFGTSGGSASPVYDDSLTNIGDNGVQILMIFNH